MRKSAIILLGIGILCFCLTSMGLARTDYDTVGALIGDVRSLPLAKSLVLEKLGQPDSIETMVGFPSPVEVYVVEGSDELSHAYFAYVPGEAGDLTYAVGVVTKEASGMVFEDLVNDFADMVVLRGKSFAIFDTFAGQTEKPLWLIMEEREFQGKLRLLSTVISPENTIPYLEAVYGEETRKSLEKILEERAR